MKAENKITLELKQLSVGYSYEHVLIDEATLVLNGGTLTGLLANNGMGKSTLLKTLSGTLRPLAGEIVLNGVSLHQLSLQEIAQKVSVVLTEKPQLPGITVYDLVTMGRYPYMPVFGAPGERDVQIINECLQKCGIETLMHKNCQELSDGEFQKAMIARAMAQQTEIILLDEPTAFLDYTSKQRLIALLKEIAEQENKIVLISSHDLHAIMKHAHRALVIKSDRKIHNLTGEELRNTGAESLFI